MTDGGVRGAQLADVRRAVSPLCVHARFPSRERLWAASMAASVLQLCERRGRGALGGPLGLWGSDLHASSSGSRVLCSPDGPGEASRTAPAGRGGTGGRGCGGGGGGGPAQLPSARLTGTISQAAAQPGEPRLPAGPGRLRISRRGEHTATYRTVKGSFGMGPFVSTFTVKLQRFRF